MNLYGYCSNNPICSTDPLGLVDAHFVSVMGGGDWIAGGVANGAGMYGVTTGGILSLVSYFTGKKSASSSNSGQYSSGGNRGGNNGGNGQNHQSTPAEPSKPKPKVYKHVLTDARLTKALEKAVSDTKRLNVPSMNIVGVGMTLRSFDTEFGSPDGALLVHFYEYTGTKYPLLIGRTLSGDDLNYIGVGVVFAAGNFTGPSVEFAVSFWKSQAYTTNPSRDVLRATWTGYYFWFEQSLK